MKVVVVRLAMRDDADPLQLLGSVLKHVDALHGAMIVGGDNSQILATGTTEEARAVAEMLAADDGEPEEAGTL